MTTLPASRATDLLAGATARARVPTAVTFQVTDRCNYECVHCYQEHDVKPELGTDDVKRILRELADLGVLFVALMGGEIFMRRDADEILRTAHELGFAIRLKTTGHHIHDRRADLLASLRPIEVDLSIYGADRHGHERVTRHQGSWERTVAAARRLIARRVAVVLRVPVMEVNAGDHGALEALAAELGAQVTFDPKITARHMTGDASLEPTALRMTEQTLRTFYGDSLMPALIEKYQHGAPAEVANATPCGAGQRTAGIDPRGQVWPCNVLPVPAGDLTRQSFRDIWFGSAAMDDVRHLTWARLSECNVCPVRAYCTRCHAMALIEDGEMYGPSLEACRHAVATRDALRARGLVAADHTAMPPTWDRVDPDGQHQRRRDHTVARRPTALRILP